MTQTLGVSSLAGSDSGGGVLGDCQLGCWFFLIYYYAMRDQISHFNEHTISSLSIPTLFLGSLMMKPILEGGVEYNQNDMMSRFNYSRRVLIAQAALVTVGLFGTWLLAWGSRIEDSGLAVLAMVSTWVMDIAISLGIMVAAEMEGAIMVFYIFRLLLLLWGDSYEVGSTLLPALACYGFFKIGTIVVNGLINKEEADYRQLQQRPKFIENEQRRRYINMVFLAICFVGTISIGMSSHPSQKTVLLLTVAAAVGVWLQLHLMSKSAGLHFRIISNTISYNIYFFLLLVAGIGKVYHQDFFYLLLSTIPYLIAFFFIGRVLIGSRSHKFHSSDQMFFQGSYIFKGDRGHKFYRYSSDSQRTMRVLDKLSRELLVIIYFLSFLTAVCRENYIWLPISVYLTNTYPQQDTQQLFIFNYLQAKFNVSITLRPKLTIPIVILMQALLSRETSRKEQLFDQIYQCRSATSIQSMLIYFLFGSAFLSQIMRPDIKSKTLRMLQLCCPLVCIGWVIWLQCLHLRLVLLGLYVLAYCIESISATMRARSKGGKSS